MPTARELVERGAALLDERIPDWYSQIDLDSLMMGSQCSCVLGQLAGRPVNLDRLGLTSLGNFGSALTGLNISEQAGAYGFNVADHAYLDIADCCDEPHWRVSHVYNTSYQQLSDAWKSEILSRRIQLVDALVPAQ